MDKDNSSKDQLDIVKKTVDDIKKDIKQSEDQLSDIQNTCVHSEKTIQNVGSDTYKIKWVCSICKSELGYPTEEELKKVGYFD